MMAKGKRPELRGIPGPPGPAGPRGETGARGARGQRGARGERGATGERGAQGERGTKGERGPQGPAGKPFSKPITNLQQLNEIERTIEDIYNELDIQMKRMAQIQQQVDELRSAVRALNEAPE